jgi:hypothetical protein
LILGSNALAYWLIILIVFIALSPLLQLLPNKRQRRTARMRESAILAGLNVELRSCPALRQGPPDGRDLLFYSRKRPRDGGGPGSGLWLRDGDVWRPQDLSKGAPAPAGLSALPREVLAFSSEPQRIGVFWCEQGEESNVHRIASVLQELLA